jgi:uncharacterized protein (TIGR03792 family)
MFNLYYDKRFPVEYLIFQLADPEKVDDFITIDHEVWTTYLASFDGFISKEVWINEKKPGEIHTILIWENLECWKAIPLEQLKAKDFEFKEKLGSKCEIVRRVHKEYDHGLFKIRHFEPKQVSK